MRDPLRYKLRFVRFHWRCILAGAIARDWEGVMVDYEVHMVRYARAGR